jgi:hypothetical protein
VHLPGEDLAHHPQPVALIGEGLPDVVFGDGDLVDLDYSQQTGLLLGLEDSPLDFGLDGLQFLALVPLVMAEGALDGLAHAFEQELVEVGRVAEVAVPLPALQGCVQLGRCIGD